MWRSTPNWLAISANRYPAGHFMSNQQSLGIQLAQLGRDASAAVSSSYYIDIFKFLVGILYTEKEKKVHGRIILPFSSVHFFFWVCFSGCSSPFDHTKETGGN
jgi:hypothetical protein